MKPSGWSMLFSDAEDDIEVVAAGGDQVEVPVERIQVFLAGKPDAGEPAPQGCADAVVQPASISMCRHWNCRPVLFIRSGFPRR